MEVITFEKLRRIKDSLPHGSMDRIADELNISSDTVRNYFGATNYENGTSAGIHIEPGPGGGLVTLDDVTILRAAERIIDEAKN